ncbi:uncharacterized protein LOC123552975 [Mercenaria mercenaria]|uniref:uncharacterized protein LOC123552975 n=1 Tax=Mercenaria mercenaria TaxID=6596 RepID=UPI00234EF0C5|nr:uncharacterized protein LOC123552975 [Mercenaria mercenaria]
MDGHLAVLCFACVFSLGAAVDTTRQPKATGPEVVEAVVNIIRESCLFAEDRRFLRRLAYVESQDGSSPNTFRPGYYGGIWQVDNSAFLQTQHNSTLQAQYNIIQNVLGINWNTVSWTDLHKPLYSGIAAALFTILKSGHTGLSWKEEEQGNFWAHNFHGGSPASNFTELAQILDLGCTTNQQVDIVFVLDTSSSLSGDDFIRSKRFISQVVDGFMISPVETQVGVVTYSSHAHVEFDLNDHRSKADVQNAIDNIPRNTGSTATDEGIDKALYQVFNPSYGARPNVVKVLVVITDGRSDDDLNTKHAADRVHANAIVTFSVGVGGTVVKKELDTIATDPDCTHAYTVSSFEEIKFMKEEIQKATCIAPLFINTTYSCEISKCPPLAVLTGTNGTTIETNITCGGMNIYSSITNPYPTQAQYEYLQQSLVNHPTQTFFNINGKTLFINLKDNQYGLGGYNGSTGCIATITPYKGDRTDKEIHVVCYRGNVVIPCLDSYFNCTEKWNFANPCTQANVLAGKDRFPHPYQNNKFLMCDLSGKLYVVICPKGEIFQADCNQCVGENATVTSGCLTPYTGGNPCSRENILAGKLFFPYPNDAHKFIHCDVWGKPWERPCPAGMEWDQGLLTCITPSPYNPCRHHQPGQPYLYPHYCDPHMYIHCDTNHQSFEQNCQLDYVFYATSQVCVPPGSYPGTSNLVNTCYGNSTPYPYTIPTSGYYGTTSNPLHTHVFSNQNYQAPCTKANILAGLLYFRYKYNNHNYIQCDLWGKQYLRDCYPDYYDPYTYTCVDGPVFPENVG